MHPSNSPDSLPQDIQQKDKAHQPEISTDDSSISSPCSPPAAKKKKFVNSPKENNESVDESPLDAAEYTLWETLPWKARPAFSRICFHLRTNEECTDLANFAMVSKPFRNGVMEYMNKKGNQPGLEKVYFYVNEDGLWVSIHLFPSNVPFHNLASLDLGRFDRLMIIGYSPILKVLLRGSEDPIIEQITVLLSSYIKDVFVGGHICSSNLSLCAKVLDASNIEYIEFGPFTILDDTTAPSIISMSSHAKTLTLRLVEPQMSDPAAFISNLASMPTSTVKINLPFFFELPKSFWKNFFSEKLSGGSFESVKIGDYRMNINTLINYPYIDVRPLEWVKAKPK